MGNISGEIGWKAYIPGERGGGVYRATGDGEHTWRKRMGSISRDWRWGAYPEKGDESIPRERGWGAYVETEDLDLIWRKRGTCTWRKVMRSITGEHTVDEGNTWRREMGSISKGWVAYKEKEGRKEQN